MKIVNKTKNWLALMLAFLISSGSAFAAFSITVTSTLDDDITTGAYQFLDGAGGAQDSTGNLVLGTTNGGSYYTSNVFVFKIPDYPDAQLYNLRASLDFTVAISEGSSGSVDLVGIRVSLNTVLSADETATPAITILSGVTDGNFDVDENNAAFNNWINITMALRII